MLLLSLLALLQTASVALPAQALAAPGPADGRSQDGRSHDGRSHDGRRGDIRVAVPRIDTTITVDGLLDEPVWQQAAVLRGFSQYAPVDGVPAADSTAVLVWYSPTAIHFGIRAYEQHGAVHATLADRDRIGADDYVQILLGTFNDGRQATLFAVNPLGVQMDGALVERGQTSTGIGGGTAARESADLSPDYTWQSKGRVVPGGYEVEVRIPFKSLRFQQGKEQTWGLNVTRTVAHSGYEDVWAPARRASASFLAQSGQLVGLTDLSRGLVLEVNPEVTSSVHGAPGDAGYAYDGGRPQVGGNLRWGITNNLNLAGTANPDFSQVESDAGQLAFDPRQSLFFSEKRPFFLDGIEQFTTPVQLIYTRRIVQPVAAAKLTGTAFGTNLALLSAVDDRSVSATNDNPVYNILRVQKDVGGRSRLGVAYTDRIEGGAYNRVADVDGRLVSGGVYSAVFQLAGSHTRAADGTVTTAPLWYGRFDRKGRTLGFTGRFMGIAEDFRAASGFINRPGIVDAYVNPGLTFYGARGGLVERYNVNVVLDGTWQYRKFIHGEGIQDRKLHLNGDAALRGGWDVQAGYFLESFGYDEGLFANYALEVPRAGGGLDTVAFTGQPRIPNSEYFVQVTTPQFKKADASVFWLKGHDENFFEWASGELIILTATVNVRPTDKLRLGFTYNWQQVNRRTDGSRVNVGRIPRLKVEYQLARPIFLRAVGQYVNVETDSLRDDSRTGAPILLCDAGLATCRRTAATVQNDFRADLLFAYQPTPGTVFFAGYGSSMEDGGSFRFRDLRRTGDGFFLKLSYLFRL